MTKIVTKHIKSCEKCQKSKTTIHTKSPMTITETPNNAFDIVLVDTIGSLPKSENGNEYAVTLILKIRYVCVYRELMVKLK